MTDPPRTLTTAEARAAATLARAEGLQNAVTQLTNQLGRVRWWQRLGLIALAFDLVLTSLFAVAWLKGRDAQASTKTLCQSSNATRAVAAQLWDGLLPVVATTHPADAAQIAHLKQLADASYVQRNC